MVTEKFKTHKSPDIDQIPAEFIKAGGRTIRCEIQKLINYIWNKEKFSEEWKKSIILCIYKKGDKTDLVIIEACHFVKCVQTFIPHPLVKANYKC